MSIPCVKGEFFKENGQKEGETIDRVGTEKGLSDSRKTIKTDVM